LGNTEACEKCGRVKLERGGMSVSYSRMLDPRSWSPTVRGSSGVLHNRSGGDWGVGQISVGDGRSGALGSIAAISIASVAPVASQAQVSQGVAQVAQSGDLHGRSRGRVVSAVGHALDLGGSRVSGVAQRVGGRGDGVGRSSFGFSFPILG